MCTKKTVFERVSGGNPYGRDFNLQPLANRLQGRVVLTEKDERTFGEVMQAVDRDAAHAAPVKQV